MAQKEFHDNLEFLIVFSLIKGLYCNVNPRHSTIYITVVPCPSVCVQDRLASDLLDVSHVKTRDALRIQRAPLGEPRDIICMASNPIGQKRGA